MAKQPQKLSFTFVDPNEAEAFERAFRKILIEKLASQQHIRMGKGTANENSSILPSFHRTEGAA